MSDADTEEALAEFDFLVSVSRDGGGEARSQADTDWGKLTVTDLADVQRILFKLCQTHSVCLN